MAHYFKEGLHLGTEQLLILYFYDKISFYFPNNINIYIEIYKDNTYAVGKSK